MTDEIMKRHEQWQKEREEAVVSAFEEPEKFDQEYVRNLYEMLIEGSKRSIRFMQEDMTHLIRLREKYPNDLEIGELIWNNIQLTSECILMEAENINEYRKTIG